MSSRRPHLHFILILFTYYCSSTHTAAANGGNGITVQCLPDHAASLLQLKRSFHNPNLSSWQHGTDCCHWEGVGCDKASGQLITLDLGDRDLRSTTGLSPALFNLTSLRNLSLAGNDFGMASLPNFGFERLIELLSLNLSHARLSGQIPIGMSHLQNLLNLDLSNNYMYLRQPSFGTLVANLSNLRSLNLDIVDIGSGVSTWSIALADSVPLLQHLSLFQCLLNGPAPIHHSFSRLRFLATINLANNGITGQFPSFFADFSFLRDLHLWGNSFEGQFPPKIFYLENLRDIDVAYNPSLSVQLPDFQPGNTLESLYLRDAHLSGAIPDSFAHLKSLKFLGLSNIGSSKQHTTSIANLTSLNALWLSGSGIEKPTLSWIASLENLTDLALEGYDFSGPIPWWIRNCTNLMSLDLTACSLSGAIPLWIGNLTKLSYLDLSNNRLSGKIPMVMFALSSLEELLLSSNELYGTLDDIPDPSSSLLNMIDLSDNNFTGHIPKSYFDLTKLKYLNLGSNRFEGTVELSLLWKPKELHSLTLSNNMLSVTFDDSYPFPYVRTIRTLELASCNLTKIPVALRYANELSYLDLSNNRMYGAIPNWIWVNWKDSIASLDLSNNMFTSLENSPSIVNMTNLYHLNLSSNKLHGSVPIPLIHSNLGALLDYSNNSFSSITPDFGRYLSNKTYYLDLSRNILSGHIPTSICSQLNLQILDLSYNNFSGLVPSCLMQGGNSLSVLKLRDNHLHGMLPENIGKECMLQTIDLNNNQIEGKIPRALSNCNILEVLDIGSNQIIDVFPHWLGKMSNLRILILRFNQFYGSIEGPTESDAASKHFSSLQIIDLASNNFSGSLNSKWFNKLETMVVNSTGEGYALDLYGRLRGAYYQEILTFKGIDLTFTRILTTFKIIDFSNNAFAGPIPDSIGKLIALHGLNMSRNAFAGRIPSKFADLAQLESLDLSQNKLSGLIPRDLTSLTYLAVLNLSYNNLTGMIPEGQQFLSFSNSSFEGNEGLCGKPLSKECNSSSAGTLGSSVSSQDSVGTIVLFVFVGSGFGVGFAVAVVLSVVWRAKWWNYNCFRLHQC